MRVKLCKDCPYTRGDLGDHYDTHAEEYCCIRCPNQGMLHMERGQYPHHEYTHPERTLYQKRRRIWAPLSLPLQG